MACQYCNSKNKIVKTIAWAVYLAPLAYTAYVFLKESGAFDKIADVAEPYVGTVTEKANEVYETVKDTVIDVYTDTVTENAEEVTQVNTGTDFGVNTTK